MTPKDFARTRNGSLKLTADEAASDLLSALRSEFTAEAERIAKEESKSCLALLHTLEESLGELQSIGTNANKKKSSPVANKKKTIGATVQTAKTNLKSNMGTKRKKITSKGNCFLIWNTIAGMDH
jgi:hypothetical protein